MGDFLPPGEENTDNAQTFIQLVDVEVMRLLSAI